MKTLTSFLKLVPVTLLTLTLTHLCHATDPGSGETFIWETRINDCSVVIAGTVHVGRADCYPMPELYRTNLEDADMVVLEVAEDFDEIEPIMLDYIQKDRLSEEKYFRHTLSPDARDKMIEILGSDRFHNYDQYDAWVLLIHLTANKMKLMNYDPRQAVDRHLRDLAEEAGKEIGGLEDVQDQFRLLEFDLPYPTQLQILEQQIANIEQEAAGEAALYDAYFNQAPGQFGEVFTGRFDFENPQINAAYNKVFSHRNKAWADTLETLTSARQGKLFVAVGAGHLFGPSNLLQCLEEKGYEVNPLIR